MNKENKEALYNITIGFTVKVIEQIQKTVLVLLKPSGVTWIYVSYAWANDMIDMDPMSYILFCIGIMGVKTWKRIKEMRGTSE